MYYFLTIKYTPGKDQCNSIISDSHTYPNSYNNSNVSWMA